MVFIKILKKNWLIITILFLASIVRFWKIHDLTTFAGDQGIDFLIVKRMLIDGKFTLLGPKLGTFSDIAIVYLGPIYYFMIAPFLYIFNLDPIGPAIFTAILSILTVLLIYVIAVTFFNRSIAIFASAIFAFNVHIINQSRVALNPNPIPFFSAILIFSLFKITIHNSNNLIWPILGGISSGILFQLHYLTISLIFLSALFVLNKRYFVTLVTCAAAFFLTISPQLIFELRHNFFISKQVLLRIQNGEDLSTLSDLFQNLYKSIELYSGLIFYVENFYLGIFIIALISLTLSKMAKFKKASIFLAASVLISLFFASIYSFEPQSHYFAHVYVGLSILFATLLNFLMTCFKNQLAKNISILILGIIIVINFLNLNPNAHEGYTMPKGWNLTGVKKTSKIISKDVANVVDFNIAAALDGDVRARPYRYLVEVYGKTPLGVEEYPNASLLYLISRDSEPDIYNYAVWEVSSFKPFEIVKKWPIQNNINLYKLEKTSNK